ncbi:MAG: HAMP domain-containing histidine kinase, partial [Bacteroidales bacterium]|nr:HAMP domain-containing histidine kinase [Bacteroidales bacterium]
LTASVDIRSGISGVHFSIKDFGMGIDEAESASIFESFYTTKPEGIGTGLGLFISKKIIEDHKGEIWFESQKGAGTTFHIFIPYQN